MHKVINMSNQQSKIQNIIKIIESDKVLRSIVRVLLMINAVKFELDAEVDAMFAGARRIHGYGDDTEATYLEEYADKFRAHVAGLDEAVEEATRLMIRYLSRVTGKPVMHSYSVENERDVIAWKYAEDVNAWCLDFDYIDKDGRVHELTSICLD